MDVDPRHHRLRVLVANEHPDRLTQLCGIVSAATPRSGYGEVARFAAQPAQRQGCEAVAARFATTVRSS